MILITYVEPIIAHEVIKHNVPNRSQKLIERTKLKALRINHEAFIVSREGDNRYSTKNTKFKNLSQESNDNKVRDKG